MAEALPERDFEAFVRAAEERLSFAFAAAWGPEVGMEATQEALAYAWENWDRVAVMANPLGYLFRVGQSKARRHLRWRRPVVVPPPQAVTEPWIEPGLPVALARLSRNQRVVVLVEGFAWTQREVAELLGISRSSVQKHLGRGMARLRTLLVVIDA